MPNPLEHFAREMRFRRKQEKMSQEIFAEKTGVSIALISGIERGVASPTFQTLEKIASYFNVPVTEMLVAEEHSTTINKIRLEIITHIMTMDSEELGKVKKFITTYNK